MSTANDFLQKLQSATVKSTVQQKQKSRPNASAAELSKMLMAATGQGESVLPETTSVTQMPVQEKKSYEAVKEKSGAADLSEKKAAASSFLQESVVRQEMSTQQKEKKTKLPLSESKENGGAGIASLIQKALAAKEKMQQAVPVMERVGGLRSEFEAVFQPQAEAMKEENEFISTASFRRTKEKEGHLNVAAYIRVSTDSSDQENSYETQERYFHQLIENNPDWNPIGVYSDYGISGTVKDKRVGFKRLLRHCRERKIDRIVCKSISRFSRNTADFMTALNTLHDNNVTILFEKENLDTADPTSDFILTTLAAIAQEESRSISRNINLGNKMRYPRGEVKNMVIYGYRYNGKMVTTESGYQYRDIEIVEEEAKIVRRIFQEVAEGTAYTDVARGLNYDRIPAPETVAVKARKKNSKKGQLNSNLEEGWTGRIISQMIQRERYTGAVLIQKKYTVDFLNHNTQRNNGELPQYLVKNHHPAIIDEELFETVQEIRRANAAQKEKGVKKGSKPFSGRILCGECGRFFRVRNSKHYPVWFCPTAEIYNGKRICHTERVYEEQIVRAFRKAIIERFRLSAQPIHDNVEVADIMSGRYGEQFEGFTKEADDFVPQMIKRLENIQHTDFMERDRAFYKRQIATLQIGMESSGKKLRLLESQNDVMQTRRELLGDESIDEAVIQSNAEKIRRLKEKLDRDMDEKKHLRDPAIVIRKDSITFNTACITGLEDVVYVHVMFNNDLKRIVVRGCDENDKDALRWCIAKPDKRKSRKMSCKPFAELVYKEMDWDSECRYKVLGYRITFEGETLYVFDLLVPEIFHERQSRKKETVAEQPTDQETKPVDTRKGFYPDDIAGTFGVPVEEHLRESEVRQMDGYVSMGVLTGRTVPDTGLD